jgi:diguanylate cyclase (GGDEF)-like protein
MPAHTVDTFLAGPAAEPPRFSKAESARRDHILSLVSRNTMVACAYWSLAALGKWYFSSYQMWPAPLWLPAGVALFAAVAVGRWSWVGIFLGALLTDTITFREPLAWAACYSFANTLAPLLAAELIRERITHHEPFSRVAEVIYICFAVFINGMISATICATVICAKVYAPFNVLIDKWFDWMLSDAGAALLITPFLLLFRLQPFLLPIRKQRGVFLISTASSILTVGYLLFGTTGIRAADAGASFLVLLPLLWTAVRLSLRVAYPMYVVVMLVTIVGTMSGRGPFFGVEPGGALIIFAQIAVGFGGAVLLLGGAANEQRAAEDELRKLNLDLEGRVEQRTSELREIQRQLEKAAFYDPLTGLPNRRLLEERFAFCAATSRRKGESFCVLLIDLDHFKLINDNFGHDAGDAMLIETGQRLINSVRECDVVSRIGGDEFVILLPETNDRNSVDAICLRILATLTEPVSFNEQMLRSSPSIGIAVSPDHGATWQLLYKAADMAVYHAKRAGRQTWQWYVPEVSTATHD